MSHKENVEAALDFWGPEQLNELIVEICEEKAGHIRENWQDEVLARAWLQVGSQFGHLGRKHGFKHACKRVWGSAVDQIQSHLRNDS